jgi:hypothetical protein
MQTGGKRRAEWLLAVALSAVSVLLGACATPTVSGNRAEATKGSVRTVYVVHHGGLHTGLAVKRSDIPGGHWPASRDFAGSRYLEMGWGDDDGYRKPLTSGIALKALLGDKRTVLFGDGFSQPLRQKYGDPKVTVLAVRVSEAGLAEFCDHIQRTYAVDELGQPIGLGGGWYRARGTYSAFNTCNTWVAAGLEKAGCPISPAMCLTAGQLLRRVRPFARLMR